MHGASDPLWVAIKGASPNAAPSRSLAAMNAIDEGKVKSIIHPTLADHVRREAVKFVDECRRHSSPSPNDPGT